MLTRRSPAVPRFCAAQFKSWGPEVVNGRLAMVAFFTGAAAEMASGVPTLTQFTESHWAFVLATLLIVPASFMPRFQGETTAKPESKENGMWQASTELLNAGGLPDEVYPGAELLNGRAAMVGLSAMFLQEAITGNPVF